MNNKKIVYELKDKAIRPVQFHYSFIERADIFSTVFVHNEKLNHSTSFETTVKNYEIYLTDNDWYPPSQPILLYFYIECPVSKDVVFHFRTNTTVKLWVNYRLSSMDVKYYNYVFTDKLEQGENLIAIEMIPTKNERPFFTCRFHDLISDQRDRMASLTVNNTVFYKTRVRIISSQLMDIDSQPIKLMAILDDKYHIDAKQTISVKLIDRDENVLYQFSSQFNRVMSIDINRLFQQTAVKHNVLIIRILYDYNGSTEYLDEVLITGAIEHTLNPVIQKARDALSDQDFVEEGKPYIAEMLQDLESYQKNISNPCVYFRLTCYLSEMIDAMQTAGSFNEYFYSPGFKRKYFISALDGRTEYVNVLVPEGYRQNTQEKYPLLVYISVNNHTEYCRELSAYNTHGMIVADISPKGVTQGSYIGEAAMLNALEQLLSAFPIDEERIYLTGFSNGATSAWILAQNYPHLFAGIIPLTGTPIVERLDNLYNVPVLWYSEFSSYLHQSLIRDKVAALPNFKQVDVDEFTHQDFLLMRGQLNAINYIAQYKRNKCPPKIMYSTREYRHNKAYWVTIDELAAGKNTAKIICEVVERTIWTDVENIKAFTMTLPPYVGNNFNVIINRTEEFAFTNYVKSSVSFRQSGSQWAISDETPYGTPCLSNKGLGLLNVYLDPVNIYVPDMDNAVLMKAAETFSHPRTNGFDPSVNIRYPIKSIHDISTETEKSIIILDCNSENKMLGKIRATLNIAMDQTGFFYKGVYYKGNYCIMQITSDTAYGKHLLYINCNDTHLLARNLFTRKIVLPSYASGLHPYLNNEALIYMNRKHYAIYEWGMDIEEIDL